MNPTPVEVALQAEKKLAEIARTRRPTEEESKAAMAAYRAARRWLEAEARS